MKKQILYFVFGSLLFSSIVLNEKKRVEAEHTSVLNANNLLIGTIPNERQDESSVTLQGNNFSIF